MGHSMRGHFKMKIDYRDGRRCAICGAGEPDTHIGRHHIKPRKEGGQDVVWNVITLCKRHHEQADEERIPREDLFTIVRNRNEQLHWLSNVVQSRRRRKEKIRGKQDPKRYFLNRRRASRGT